MVAFGEHGDTVDVGVAERAGEGVGVKTDADVRDIGAGVEIEVMVRRGNSSQRTPSAEAMSYSAPSHLTTAPMALGPR